MRVFNYLVVLMLLVSYAELTVFACDEATVSLVSSTDNGGGTFTYVIDVCTEHLGLESHPEDVNFEFYPTSLTIQPGFTPATYSTSGGDVYTGSIVGGSVLNYNLGSIFPIQSPTLLCNTFTITVDGEPTGITVDVHVGNSGAECRREILFCNLESEFAPAIQACNDAGTITLSANYSAGTENGTVLYDWSLTDSSLQGLAGFNVSAQSMTLTLPTNFVTPLGGVTAIVAMFDDACIPPNGAMDYFTVVINDISSPECSGSCVGGTGFVTTGN